MLRVGSAGWSLARKKYSDVYLWMVLNKIFAGMRSVDFHFVTDEGEEGKKLCTFLENNANIMLWQWWSRGFVSVAIKEYGYEVVTENIMLDGGGHVIEPEGKTWVTFYCDEYAIARKTPFGIIKNELEEIDALRSSDNYLTLSLGAIGILTGRELGMSELDKERFLDEVKSKVGTTPDKYQFLIATGAVEYKPINIPVKDLNLDGKAERSLKLICDYFNVPYDIISFSGASTYANMEQAVKLFYSNCISSLAEMLLSVGRHIIKRKTDWIVSSSSLTFSIDNTSVVTDERAKDLAMLKDAAETVTALQTAGIDASGLAEKIAEEAKQ